MDLDDVSSAPASSSFRLPPHLEALRRHKRIKEGYQLRFTYLGKMHKGVLTPAGDGESLCITGPAGEFDNPGAWLEAEASRTRALTDSTSANPRFNAWEKIKAFDLEGQELGTLASLRQIETENVSPNAACDTLPPAKRTAKRRSKIIKRREDDEPADDDQNDEQASTISTSSRTPQRDQGKLVQVGGRRMRMVKQSGVEVITMGVVARNSYRTKDRQAKQDKATPSPAVSEENMFFEYALGQQEGIEESEAEEKFVLPLDPEYNEQITDGPWKMGNTDELKLFGSPFLGSGSFSVVRRGRWLDMPVAVKCINPQKKQYNKENLQREVDIWWPLRHPNIVQLYGAIMLPDRLYFVMERMCINLQQACEIWDERRIFRCCKRWAMQVASAMCCVHDNDVLHRDLKDGNILLTRDGLTCKLADFGTASKCKGHDVSSLGTPEFMAPELAQPGTPHDKGMDVYSFGILLWKLLHPKIYPYPGLDPVQNGQGKQHKRAILKYVASGGRPTLSKKVDEEWAQLIRDCWDQTPSKRPTFKQILVRVRELSDPIED